ncbi:MAG: tetratricopeptide repeat protein [Spirochaetes bacterium]|nr:tetratricopeptide repeat protein [Spirochaetota bacterium]
MMTEELKNLLEHYNKGLTLYRERKFKDALQSFKKALEVRPEDGPSKVYIERCEVLIKDPPPANWDGVFTMTTK